MKKNVFLAATLSAALLLGSVSVFAADTEKNSYDDIPLIAPAPQTDTVTHSEGYTILVNNETVQGEVYQNNGIIMVPLRTVAEKLGFKVMWDNEKQGVTLDDNEVTTTVYIGMDSYYMASSQAIGMSAPTALGSAPELKNDTTYVPAKMFAILFCDDSAVSINDSTVSINSDTAKNKNDVNASTQIPSPITTYKTVDEAMKAIKFTAVVPKNVPNGYVLNSVSTIDDELLQLNYKNGDTELEYRVAKSKDDISGDYNTYKTTKTVNVGKTDVTVRIGEDTTGAVWTDGELSFSLYVNKAISEKEISDTLKSIM